jgi:hypothetical protein
MFQREIKNILRGEPLPENAFTAEGWPGFISTLDDNYLLPFFYLYSQGHQYIPQDAITTAKKHYEDALIINDYSLALLKEISSDVSAFGRVVTIKGFALSEHIYREPQVRPMGDIDLYLPDGAIDDVKAVFEKAGFSQYGSYQHVLSNGKIHIDLHGDLWGAQRIPARKEIVAGISESSVPSSLIPGFFTLSPELLAVHTAYHCIKHNFSRLIWALDLQLLYNAGNFNALLQRKGPPFALFALEWLAERELIDIAHIPSTGLRGIRKSMLKKVTGTQSDAGLGEFSLALLCPSPAATIRYALSSLFPPRHILRDMYGNKPFPLLMFRRIFELFKHMIRAFKWKKK